MSVDIRTSEPIGHIAKESWIGPKAAWLLALSMGLVGVLYELSLPNSFFAGILKTAGAALGGTDPYGK